VECILCGTPVIASDIPSMREIFRDYPVFLVHPDEDLTGRIEERINEYDALSDAAESAGISFRERFSGQSYIESMNIIYSTWNG
jgi:glycosyltransferase involved in cell wall biosynthesis